MGTWIEMVHIRGSNSARQSFPAMGTWIEIRYLVEVEIWDCVVPCNGNVDWNVLVAIFFHSLHCRSLQWERGLKFQASVQSLSGQTGRSLQWERGLKCTPNHYHNKHSVVVPCNGNVDWNIFSRFRPCGGIQSFPAMGTWIEILRTVNTWTNQHRRSLQWERGLKYVQVINYLVSTRVVPCNGNVDWNLSFYSFSMTFSVVPCNGNVDWNVKGISVPTYTHGRSLQWERGLKLFKW